MDLDTSPGSVIHHVLGVTFEEFRAKVQEISLCKTIFIEHHEPKLIETEPFTICSDALFAVAIQRDENWWPIEQMIGTHGSRRPYMNTINLIHYYPFTSIYEVRGYRLSVGPQNRRSEPVTLFVEFLIERTRSSAPKRLLTRLSRTPKWV